MGRLVIAVLCAATIASCAVAPRRPEKFKAGDYAYVKQYISWLLSRDMSRNGIHGLSIALVDDGETVWADGFGYADVAGKQQADSRTIYRVASISKLFTTMAIMRLSEKGLVKVDNPLADHIPGFSIKTRFKDSHPITIRSVLTHHSGLPSDYTKGMWTDKPKRFTSLVPLLRDEYAISPPGFAFVYSNVGFSLLGCVVEKASGKRYEDYMQEEILAPLGMSDSAFEIKPPMRPLVSKAYRGKMEERLWPLRDIPAAGLYSNVTDLARFISFVNSGGGGVISRESFMDTIKPQNLGVKMDFDYKVGLSWMLTWPGLDYAGTALNHTGATIAHRSVIAVIPDRKLGVVVLANTASARGFVDMIAAETLKLAIEIKTGIKPPRPSVGHAPAIEMSEDRLSEYAGHYISGPGMAAVTAKDGKLYAHVTGLSGKMEMVPRKGGVFTGVYTPIGSIPIYLKELDGLKLSLEKVDGRSVLLSVRNGMRFAIGEKVEPAPISQAWLSRLGDLELANLGGDFPGVPYKGELAYENGFLVVNSVSWFLGGNPTSIPICPVSDTEAVVCGFGRGRGETVKVIERNGEEFAVFSGYEYKMKKKG